MGCTQSQEIPFQAPHNPPLYKGIKVGLKVMCRDRFVSKYSGDTMYKWRNAEVIDVKDSSINVHFLNWSNAFDIWIDLNEEVNRISPIGLLSKPECDSGSELTPQQLLEVIEFLHSGTFSTKCVSDINIDNFSVGENLDVLDIFYRKGSDLPMKKWRKAKVLSAEGTKITITYIGWNSKFDEVLDLVEDANRISKFGTKSNEQTSLAIVSPSPHKTKVDADRKQLTVADTVLTTSSISLTEENGYRIEDVDPQTREEFEAEINREIVFMQVLASQGLHVIEIEGDGNCLFRAVSHQLYLSEDYHEMLRARCVEHMQRHRKRFECFCTSDFETHLREMAIPGTWGDDLEIRALEEILDRIICIYSSSCSPPTQPIQKNFEEEKLLEGVPPLKLSFHGNSHYNSIFDNRQPLPLPLRNSTTLLSARIKLCTSKYMSPSTRNSANSPGIS